MHGGCLLFLVLRARGVLQQMAQLMPPPGAVPFVLPGPAVQLDTAEITRIVARLVVDEAAPDAAAGDRRRRAIFNFILAYLSS